jgi:hypothetical protein
MKIIRLSSVLLIAGFCLPCPAQTTKWYKFDKGFIERTFPQDSAIGVLSAVASHPASQVHPISCGGSDGELHIGIAPEDIRGATTSHPVSGPANTSEAFGIVAEPPNASANLLSRMKASAGAPIAFFGYYRVWNEGHDVGTKYPSNPHHVLEVHPAWGIKTQSQGQILDPQTIFPMPAYRGYGPTKYERVLSSVSTGQWLQAAEDDQFLYVQLVKAENFYQLPVHIKQVKGVSQGIEADVDVLSSISETDVVYADLTIIAARGSEVATQLAPEQTAYLLGFFSVNLRKALTAAVGHEGPTNSVFVPQALEFFTFGFPKRPAVPSCSGTEDN